jgi:multidrug/hemolysin transport system permease protein
MFPANIQKIFAFIPAHHSANMMREVMTKEPLAASFGNVTDQTVQSTFMTAQEIVDIYAAENGITYLFGDIQVTMPVIIVTRYCLNNFEKKTLF